MWGSVFQRRNVKASILPKMYRCSVSRQKLEGHKYSQMETQWKSILCNSLMKCLPSQARCLKTFFLLCFKLFCLGTCFLQRVPLRECTLCLLGSHSLLYPEAPEGQQSHHCGILAHGKVGLIPPITIGLNLYLAFSPYRSWTSLWN